MSRWRELVDETPPFFSDGEPLLVSADHPASGRLLLHLEGEFTLYEIGTVRKALLENSLADHETVIADLGGVRFIDGAGLAFLVLLHRRPAETGTSLRIGCPDIDLRKMFLIAQLDQELNIQTSIEHALW